MRLPLLCLLAALAAPACSGRIGDGPNLPATGGPGPRPSTSPQPSQSPSTSPTPSPTPTPAALTDGWPSFGPHAAVQLRRLTTEQYLASVKSLLGVSTAGIPLTEPVSPVSGFPAIGAASAAISSNGVAQFEGAAGFLAAAVIGSPSARASVSPCAPSSITDETCFRAFITRFGRQAFRRALTAEEVDAYAALTLMVAGNTNDPWQGIQSTISAFLQSPNFLYLPEIGEPDPDQAGRMRFTNEEMASRLSYFLTGDRPDDALLDAAEAGELTTSAGLTAAIDRLLAKDEARAAVRSFFSVMLALEGLDNFTRPAALYPAFTPTLGAALKEETLRTLEDAVFDRDLDYRRVFDQRETFVNAELASFYGVPAPSGSGFQRVSLPEGPRRGLLGQAGVLAVHDHESTTSPTKRGLFVLTRLLCQPLALAPPAGVRIPPLPTGMLTARQKLAPHSSITGCAGCHVAMDAVGLSLEHFDAMGVYRDTDHNLAIDDSGVLGPSTYRGEAELASLIANAPAAGPCLISALYGVSVGHLADDFDKDSFAALVHTYDTSGGRVRAVLKAIAQSDGFRFTTGATP
ncbi:MAG: DUF1592 domain-containing protein [Myxococcota bacterium]